MPHPDTTAWLIVLWLFVIGGAVGSFLNVVVYRLPLGISLIHPPSHCPKCGKRIPWYDNVPILGWIALRGRCRQCHDPISIRYPLVEAITAAMFGLLAVVEMDRLGTTYPIHLLLLCTLLCAGLIEYDGNRPPWRMFLPALVVGALAQMFRPAVVFDAAGWRGLPMWLSSTVVVLAILGIPAWVGVAGWTSQHSQARRGPVLGLVCVGLGLGWCAGGVVAAASAVFSLLLWPLRHYWPRLHIPPTMLLGLVTLVWILAWARLVSG